LCGDGHSCPSKPSPSSGALIRGAKEIRGDQNTLTEHSYTLRFSRQNFHLGHFQSETRLQDSVLDLNETGPTWIELKRNPTAHPVKRWPSSCTVTAIANTKENERKSTAGSM
jgi:hypothetical protein